MITGLGFNLSIITYINSKSKPSFPLTLNVILNFLKLHLIPFMGLS